MSPTSYLLWSPWRDIRAGEGAELSAVHLLVPAGVVRVMQESRAIDVGLFLTHKYTGGNPLLVVLAQ